MHSFWHQSPLIRVAVSLIVGIGIGNLLPLSQMGYLWTAGLFSAIFLLLFWYKYKRKSHRYRFQFGGLILFSFVAMGTLLVLQARTRHDRQLSFPENQELTWIGEISEFPNRTQKSTRLELVIHMSLDSNNVRQAHQFSVIAYAPQTEEWDSLSLGDEVVFKGKILPTKHPINPGQFDYGEYLRKKGIVGTVFLKEDAITTRPTGKSFSLDHMLKNIQAFCVKRLAANDIPNSQLGVASALVLGKRSLVEREIRNQFADAGVVHILAVSGLHVGIIYYILLQFLNLFFKNGKRTMLKLVLITLCLWIYAGITGLSPSVLRAATMFSFVAIGKEKGKKGSIYNMLAVSAIVLLVPNPFLLFEVGFQLSYAAVIGIAMFHRPIYGQWYIKNKFLDKTWSLMVVSFSAQLATFPLAVYYFNQFPNYFLLSNLLVIPLATVGLYVGLATVALSWIPYLGWVISKLLSAVFGLLIYIVELLAGIPGSKTEFLHIGLAAVFLLYFLIYFTYKFVQSPIRWSMWWPFGFICLLLTMFLFRNWKVYHTSELVILEGAKEPIVLIQNGSKAWAYSISPEKNQSYYLDGYRTEKGIRELHWLDENLPSFLEINDEGMRIKTDVQYIDSVSNSTICILSLTIGIDESRTDFFILNSKFSTYKRARILENLKRNGLHYWDMNERGIYRLELGQ